MTDFPAHIVELFSPDDIVDMSGYVDDCRCECQQHFTVQDALLHVHGRPIFDRLLIKGDLILPDNQEIRRLPDILAVTGTVILSGCLKLEYMPSQLFADRIFLDDTLIRELPTRFVADTVDLTGCPNIKELPGDTEVRVMKAAGCTNLKEIPAGLKFASLDLSGTAVVELPADLTISHELRLRSCSKLTTLNEGMSVGAGIDVRGCDMLFTLPRSVQPAIAITDGMMLANDLVILPNMSSEEAAMCLGVKAIAAFPARHLKNLVRMQEPVTAVDRDGRGAVRGRAIATLGSRAKKPAATSRHIQSLAARLNELVKEAELKLLQ